MSIIMLFINNIELYSPVTVVLGVVLLGLTINSIYDIFLNIQLNLLYYVLLSYL